MKINPLLLTDSYKLSHKALGQQVTGGKLTRVQSNLTARGTRVEGNNETVFYGLQAWIKELTEMFEEGFFSRPVEDVLEEYRNGIDGFVDLTNFDDSHIRELHELGYLPLEIRAVKEGTIVPVRVPTMIVENTHEDFAWLVNYLETWWSSALWQPSTNATTAWRMRKLLDEYATETTGQTDSVDFQFHDFSFRGLANWESASSLGSAHLTSFKGSDNVPAKTFVEENYAGEDNGLIAGSVIATEHSTMVYNGQSGEEETYRRLIENNPTGILSVVSDTWNLWNVLTNILPNLKEEILGRDGALVIRPDSGVPADIICGTERLSQSTGFSEEAVKLLEDRGEDVHKRELTPEEKGVVELLWETFGGTYNEQGYRVLNPKIGAIYGDSINFENAREILDRLKAKGFASTNIVLGAGSFLYNGAVGRDSNGNFVVNTRDTYAHAVKSTWAEIDGEGVNLLKDPITDSGTKKSATGRLAVLAKMSGELYLVEKASPSQEEYSFLEPVWKDGMFLRHQSLNDVRETLKLWSKVVERLDEDQ